MPLKRGSREKSKTALQRSSNLSKAQEDEDEKMYSINKTPKLVAVDGCASVGGETARTSCTFTAVRPLVDRSSNLAHMLVQNRIGLRCSSKLKQSVSYPVKHAVNNFQLHRSASLFDRRCTAVQWHPFERNLFVVGSKGGDITLWNVMKGEAAAHLAGIGPGGSIQAIQFLHRLSPSQIVAASIDGTVTVQDFTGRHKSILLDTLNCHDYWYCSVDVNSDQDNILAGDNTGNVTLLSLEGKKVMKMRLHKQKVTHVEFSKKDPHVFCTGSLDRTVKLWDRRMIQTCHSALCVLQHNRPINSACFGGKDGTSLLTTDQHSEIRVYQTGSWCLEQCIQHPHRFFQHITPIKACWHPFCDIIAVGRYPDANFPGSGSEPRSVDLIEASAGTISAQLVDSQAPGLISLNQFSPDGTMLLSAMGCNILLWKNKEDIIRQTESLANTLHNTPLPNAVNNRRPRSRPSKSKPDKNKAISVKVNLKVKQKKPPR